jgi:hypothetical protein
LRSSRRFSRPFTLAQLTPANVTGLQGQHGRGLVDQALQQACRAIAQTLSESEFVTVASGTVLIGFPETASANAEPLIAQARAAVTAALDLKLDFSVTLREGNDAIEFLGRL